MCILHDLYPGHRMTLCIGAPKIGVRNKTIDLFPLNVSLKNDRCVFLYFQTFLILAITLCVWVIVALAIESMGTPVPGKDSGFVSFHATSTMGVSTRTVSSQQEAGRNIDWKVIMLVWCLAKRTNTNVLVMQNAQLLTYFA